MTLMESGGNNTNSHDSDHFLANLIILLIQPYGKLNLKTKCSLVFENLPKILDGILDEVSCSLIEEGCPWENLQPILSLWNEELLL